jgi:ATP-dependent DNA helicase RecG
MAKNIITSLSDIPQSKLKQLNDAGLNTAINILQYVPRRYIFWNEPVTDISVLTKEDHKNIVLKLKICKKRDINKGVMYSCVDEKHNWVNVFIFYSRYINFSNGDYIWFYGTAKYNFEYKNWSMSASAHRKANEISIEPAYPKIKGMSTEYLEMVIRAALKDNSVKEYISSDIRIDNNIMDIQAAYNIIHFPKDRLALKHAMRRYIFDVLYKYISVIDSGIVAKDAIPLNVSSLITWNIHTDFNDSSGY